MRIALAAICLAGGVALSPGFVLAGEASKFRYDEAKPVVTPIADEGVTTDPALAAYRAGDYAEAMRQWTPRAEAGSVSAQYNLGTLYAFGQDMVPTDCAIAAGWFLKAADQGFAPAQFDLAFVYTYCPQVSEHRAEAVDWYRKAAEQGHAGAQFNLGNAYEYGFIVPKDLKEAVVWYSKAADQGLAMAQIQMGNLSNSGQGLAVDHAAAVAWYRKAADQDSTAAKYNLALCYGRGEGVAQDYVEAYVWLSLAAIGTPPPLPAVLVEIDQMKAYAASHMTKKQIAQADARVKAWKPVTPAQQPA